MGFAADCMEVTLMSFLGKGLTLPPSLPPSFPPSLPPSLHKDLIGLGPFQLFLLVIAGMGFAADCMEVTLMSFLGQGLGKEWGLATQTCKKRRREGKREG